VFHHPAVRAQYLSVSEDSLQEQLSETARRAVTATPHAAACTPGGTVRSSADACFSADTKTYTREWRLWEGLERDHTWPAVRPLLGAGLWACARGLRVHSFIYIYIFQAPQSLKEHAMASSLFLFSLSPFFQPSGGE